MLDNNQLEAVNFFKGACLTLAGPGSGKTTVLVSRINNLINTYHVNPESILVITFTKDAALEMQSRFICFSDNPKAGLVNFGTFHSVFFQILRKEINLSPDSLIQGKGLIKFLKEAIKASGVDFDDNLIEGLYKEFSYLSNTGIDINDYEPDSFDKKEFSAIYNSYCSMKKELHKIDFDDMLSVTYNLFRKDPKILSKWQKRFSFYLIDEMQDMNDIQFDIVKLLASSGNIFAVGDDDQSIYGFRGANPDIMQKFPKEFEGCKVIKLIKNYRSCNSIVDASSNLISHNEMRFDKTLSANNKDKGLIKTFGFKDNIAEADYICKEVSKIIKRSSKETVSILFRNKNQSLLTVKGLTERGVPFFVKEKVANIYNHWIFKDIISYINIALGNGTRTDYLRIYNKPNRYISRNCIDKEDITFADMCTFYRTKPYMVSRIKDMQKDIERLKTMRPGSAILYIRKRIGYDDYIKEASKNSKKLYDDNMKILESVSNLSKEYRDIRSFLKECNDRVEFSEDECDESHNRIFLYTFHASKGLEFDNVFILDVNEGITPSKKAETDKALEEERRMFYVALTRAKTNLYLCHIHSRNNEKLFPSRFIEEMDLNKLFGE
ncbi:MAG: ATP-dependent helicase [Lachnospiraceae bacterium]|nr:ATP-dependent helicase [Lachnospiraceae bacterium]